MQNENLCEGGQTWWWYLSFAKAVHLKCQTDSIP